MILEKSSEKKRGARRPGDADDSGHTCFWLKKNRVVVLSPQRKSLSRQSDACRVWIKNGQRSKFPLSDA